MTTPQATRTSARQQTGAMASAPTAAVSPTGAPARRSPGAQATPRFLRRLLVAGVALMLAFGAVLVTSLALADDGLRAADAQISALQRASVVSAALHQTDLAAASWGLDKDSTSRAALIDALHDLTAQVAALSSEDGASAGPLAQEVTDYAMLIQRALDADASSVLNRLQAAHTQLTVSTRPLLDTFETETKTAVDARLSGQLTWPADVAVGVTLALLVLLGLLLARRSRRVLNLGVLVALALVAVGWFTVSRVAGAGSADAAYRDAISSSLPAVRNEASLAMVSQQFSLARKSTAAPLAGDPAARLKRALTLVEPQGNLYVLLEQLNQQVGSVAALAGKSDWAGATSTAKSSVTTWAKAEAELTAEQSALWRLPITQITQSRSLLLTAGVIAVVAVVGAAAALALGINQRLREYR